MKKKKRNILIISLIILTVLAFLFYEFYAAGFLAGYGPSGDENISSISLPEGFSIELYAEVPGARSIEISESGTLFVGTRDEGKVYAVKDREVIEIASGLQMPNGVAMLDEDLYVAEISRILKFENIEQNLDSPVYQVLYDNLPGESWHGWKFIKFGPDRKLYIPIGAPCNVCLKEGFANINRMNADGTGFELFAEGVRNTVGFDWHPETGELWFTDNGRDWMGDNIPPDELNHAPEKGMHFGFPYCHGSIQDDEFDSKDCSEFQNPALELGPHVAALGMEFYEGEMFEGYQGGIFIAEHGSWNRKDPIGYRIIFVEMNNSSPVSSEIFAEGWLKEGKSWGRPVDIEIMEDGSMLVSDDKGGKIYRISR